MATKINNGGYQQPMDPRTGKFMNGKASEAQKAIHKKVSFIENQAKLNKIREMAKNGDQRAKDFLFSFRNMDEEEVKKYLGSIEDENANETVLDDMQDDKEREIENIKKLLKNDAENETYKKLLDLANESLKLLKGNENDEIKY